MRTSDAGKFFIKGYEQCRLKAYLPTPNDKWTIGWGHTGPEVVEGLEWTQEEADRVFADVDLPEYEAVVERHVTVPLTQPMFDALVSLAYNVGEDDIHDGIVKGFGDEMTLVKFLQAGDYERAAGQFKLWNKQAGKVLTGLSKRRFGEEAMFRAGMRELPAAGFALLELLFYVAIAAAIVATIYGAYEWVNHSWATAAGIEQGTQAENTRLTGVYKERDRKAKEEYDRQLAALNAKIAALQAANQKAAADNAANYQKGLADGKKDVDKRVAAVHAGYRLRDPGGTSGCPAPGQPAGSATGTAGTPGRGLDAASSGGLRQEAGCTLSERTSEGLYRLAGDANDAARQVNGLIAEVTRIYALCSQ